MGGIRVGVEVEKTLAFRGAGGGRFGGRFGSGFFEPGKGACHCRWL